MSNSYASKLVLSMSIVMTLLLAACGGGAAAPASQPASKPAEPAKPAAEAPKPAAPAAQPPASGAAAQPAAGAPAPAAKPSGLAKPTFPAGSAGAKIIERGKLISGMKFDVPLYGYQNPRTQEVEGFEADLARELAGAMFGDPKKIEFIQTVSRNRIPHLKEGIVDVVIATMTITKERLKEIEFSDVYYISGQRFMVPDKSTISSAADMKGKKVAVAKGGTAEINVRKVQPEAQLLFFDSHAEEFEALQNGRADVMVSDESILQGLLTKVTGYKIVGEYISYEPYGIGIRKENPEILEYTNKFVAEIKANGKWAEIHKKHLQGDPQIPPAKPDLDRVPN
ncbi:MAG: transporter substrate-binding domain-containing protein [Chloroflexi bacterium]|nr:transporter substrate-binding domain-containing protein [Chloroflexota bacterium]